MRDRTSRWILLLGTLGFGILGQFYFAKKPDYFLDGVVFYAIAAVCMIILVAPSRSQTPPATRPKILFTRAELLRHALIVGGLILGATVVLWLTRPQTTYWPIFWCWVAAIGIYLCGFVQRPQWTQQGLRSLLRTNALEWGSVALLVLAAFLLRSWRIDAIPWTLGGDEGSQGLWARDAIEGRLPNMFGLGWLSVPNMSFYWQAVWFNLLGDNVVGLRMPWAVVGALTVLGTYMLVRRLFDRGLAFLTAFLLATYHFHIHYSRLGSNQIADPFFTVWAVYFLVVGWQSGAEQPDRPDSVRRLAWAASGMVTGLAFYFYAGSRQVPIILVALLGWLALTETRLFQSQARNLLIMLGGFLVSVAPMALVALQDPDNFNARLNQVGITQSQWLANEVKKTGRSQWDLIAEQFRKAFLAYNLFPDRVAWYSPNIPLMDFWTSLFFVLGLVVSVARMLKWRYAVFVLWFVLVMALGGALTENPPSSQRLVSSAAPAVFFVAIALRELARVVRDLAGLGKVSYRGVLAGLAIVLAILSVRFYFGPYQQSWTYGSLNAEVATRIGYYLRDLGPGYKEYFFGAPRMYADFGSTPFIAKRIQLHDVAQPLTRVPDFVDPRYKPVFVFLPERIKELALVRQAYPNGVQEDVRRMNDQNGPVLFTVYRP